ncbi:hypothetical protein RA268_27835, partial [Pseudomonas syringae pv. tagetis]
MGGGLGVGGCGGFVVVVWVVVVEGLGFVVAESGMVEVVAVSRVLGGVVVGLLVLVLWFWVWGLGCCCGLYLIFCLVGGWGVFGLVVGWVVRMCGWVRWGWCCG